MANKYKNGHQELTKRSRHTATHSTGIGKVITKLSNRKAPRHDLIETEMTSMANTKTANLGHEEQMPTSRSIPETMENGRNKNSA